MFTFIIVTPTDHDVDQAVTAIKMVSEAQELLGLPVSNFFWTIGKGVVGVEVEQPDVAPLIRSLKKKVLNYSIESE